MFYLNGIPMYIRQLDEFDLKYSFYDVLSLTSEENIILINTRNVTELFHKLNIAKFQITREISMQKYKCSRIRTSSRESMEKLVRYIYQDNINIGLNRKFNKVKHLLKE